MSTGDEGFSIFNGAVSVLEAELTGRKNVSPSCGRGDLETFNTLGKIAYDATRLISI